MSRQKQQTPDFEAALAELEAIVQRLEQGELSLEESLRQFERGVVLTRNCQKALQQAEEKVRVLGPRRLEEIVNGVVEADIPWKDALLDAISPKDLVARSPQQTVDAIVARARG